MLISTYNLCCLLVDSSVCLLPWLYRVNMIDTNRLAGPSARYGHEKLNYCFEWSIVYFCLFLEIFVGNNTLYWFNTHDCITCIAPKQFYATSRFTFNDLTWIYKVMNFFKGFGYRRCWGSNWCINEMSNAYPKMEEEFLHNLSLAIFPESKEGLEPDILRESARAKI